MSTPAPSALFRPTPHSQPTAGISRWLTLLFLLLIGPAATAQLSGAYTINSAQPTAGSNFASFTDAATALNTGGVSGPVTFSVSGGPYREQLRLTAISGSSATNRVTFNGQGRIIRFGSNTDAQRAVVTLDGADYVTLDSLTVDATDGGSNSSTYGWGILLVNNADHNVIRRCTVTANPGGSSSNFAGIVSSSVATAATTTGTAASQDLTISGNTVTGGYYSVAVVGSGTTPATPNIVISQNVLRDFYFYGIYVSSLDAPQLIGNDISRPTRTTVGVFYGINLGAGVNSALVAKNRLHHAFAPAVTATSGVFAMYMSTGSSATASTPNRIVNNLIYDVGGNGNVYGFYNASSSHLHYYHNTLNLDETPNAATGNVYGLYQTSGLGVEFKNNLVRLNRAGPSYAVYLSSAAGTISTDYNDLTGSGGGFVTGYYNGARFGSLGEWQAANGGAFDQHSRAVAPQFLAAGTLRPGTSLLDGTATPLPVVTDDFTGAPRSTTRPDIGAYEFVARPYDAALESIDSPAATVTPGSHPVTVTIRNHGSVALTSIGLSYALNGGAAVSQTFALTPALVPGDAQPLTFGTLVLARNGSNTLTVTSSQPNGQADGFAANDTQNLTFVLPAAPNDEPCSAVALTGSVSGSTEYATTSTAGGLGGLLPTCSGALAPKDVWFSWTPTASSATLYLSGSAAGMVRVFTAANCSTGFASVLCQSSGATTTGVGAVTVGGLTAGQLHYVAVSGYASGDVTGSFTISTTALSTRSQINATRLRVFPNPSTTGTLTLRLDGATGKTGSVTLLNALGQSVRQQPLGAAEQQLPTSGLTPGVYTLRVQVGTEVLTQRVILQ